MKKRILKLTALLCALLLTISLCGCSLLDLSALKKPGKQNSTAYILSETTDFYAGPSWDTQVVATFQAGQTVTYDETFATADGLEWAHTEQGWFCLNGSKPEIPADYYGLSRDGFMCQTATVYEEPFFSASQTGQLSAGSPVFISQVAETGEGSWGQAETGWVLMNCVYLTGDQGQHHGYGVSLEDTVTFYSRPGVQSHATTVSGTDTRFEILEQIEIDGVWYGYTANGWVCMDSVYVEGATGLRSCTAMVIDSTPLNVRSGPGTDFDKLDKLYYGDYVEILERVERDGSDWGYTGTGWIFMDLTEVQ